MKKILSLVLVLSLVLGTFSFALAAPSTADYTEAGTLLKGLGVIKELRLDENLKRQDMIVLLSRLMGKEDVAKSFPFAPSFTDVEDPFYAPYIAWAQAERLVNGYPDGTFGFNKTITVQELQALFLRTLGYASVEWTEVPAKAQEVGIMTDLAVENSADISRGLMAAMTVNTLKATLKDGSKTLADNLGLTLPEEEEPVVEEELAMTLEQVGAKKLAVTFNEAVDTDKVSFKLTRGKININIKEVEWNEEKTVATLTTYTNLIEDEYTVTVNGLDLDENTATVEAVKSEVAKIEFGSDTLIMDKDYATNNKLTVGYKVLNQFGEEITATLDWTASTGTVSTSNGVVTLTASGLKVDDVVVLTAVHKTTGTYASASLTVAASAKIETIDLLEVKNTGSSEDDDQVMNASDNGSKYKWVLEYKAYDQYGNEVTDLTGVTITNGSTKGNSVVVEKDSDNNDIIVINPAAEETFVVTVIVPSTGAYDTATIKVNADPSVDTFTFTLPDEMLVAGETVNLPYTAYDQYGNEVTSYAELSKITITSTQGSTITWAEDPITGDVTLEYTPSAKGTDILTTTLGTDVIQLTADVNDTAVPTTIEALASDTVTNVVYKATTTLDKDSFVIKDQYGRADALDSTYSIVVEDKDGNQVGTITESGGFAIAGTETAGSASYTAYLYDGTNKIEESALSFEIVTVDKADIEKYELADIDTIYAGALTGTAVRSDYAQDIDVYGLTADGEKVALYYADDIKYINFVDGSYIAENSYKVEPVAEYTGDEDTTDTLIVAVNGANGVVILKDTITITKAAPKADKIEVKLASGLTAGTDYVAFDSDNNVIAMTVAQLANFNNVVKFVVTDQYGVTTSLTPSFYYTDSTTIDFTNNTDITTLNTSAAKAGDEFTITAMTDNGLEVSVKVLVK